MFWARAYSNSQIKITFLVVIGLSVVCWILQASTAGFRGFNASFTSKTLRLNDPSSDSLLNFPGFRLGLSMRGYWSGFPLNSSGFRKGFSNQTFDSRGYWSGSSLNSSGFRTGFSNQTFDSRGYWSGSSLNSSGFRKGFSNQTFGLNNSFHTSRQKMLIYVCEKEQGCAGWSDRQRSLTAMFLLSLLTNRRFGLLLTTPCDVKNFYVPNEYDWTVDLKDFEGRSQRLIYPADNLSKIDFNQKYTEDVLFCRVNSECFRAIKNNPHFKTLLPSWVKKGYGNYFKKAWETLMKPAPGLQRRLEKFLQSVNYYNRSQPLVGVHVRVGRNPSNPHERLLFNNISNLETLWKRVEVYVKNGSQLFVTSDCEEVRQMSRKRFGSAHHDTGGIILHVGKQRHDARACQGFGDAIFDQLVLSYCDVLFRSRGGFALRASFMHGRIRKMYYLQNGRVSPKH